MKFHLARYFHPQFFGFRWHGAKRFTIVLVISILFTLLLAACAQNSDVPEPTIIIEEGEGDSAVSSEPIEQSEPDVEQEETISEETSPVEVTPDDVMVEEEPEVEEVETPEPTPTNIPQKELVVCTAGPSPSLFLYGDMTSAAVEVRQALFENLYHTGGFAYEARGMQKIPAFTDGDARIRTTQVDEGDLVVDSQGKIVKFQEGVTVQNFNGEEVEFADAPVEMGQLIVDFSFKPLIWSDGTPVTAADSVFSYEIAADPLFIQQNSKIQHTANYEALDDLTVRWTGLPGYIDQTYMTNVWEPLPQHYLQDLDPQELFTDEKSSEFPLSAGPFVVNSWREDGSLILERNPHYYLGEEDFPILDRIIVNFGNGEHFLAGGSEEPCDVITNSALGTGNFPLLETAAKQEDWEIITVPGNIYEQIAFGINPVSEYSERRPDWFESREVRQAITMCTDRQRMIDELTVGQPESLHAYVSVSHPLYGDDVAEWPFDPQQANSLLDEAGYQDISGDGHRQDLATGVPMTVTIGTNSESALRININDIFQENMAECGIPVETYELPAGSWFSAGPQGKVFGRNFDLATLGWVGHIAPDCGLFLTDNISGAEEDGFKGWGSVNITGWSNETFDEACRSALSSMPGSEGYNERQMEAMKIFSQELPAIPLFTNVLIAAVRPRVENIHLDASQRSLFWNVYEWNKDE